MNGNLNLIVFLKSDPMHKRKQIISQCCLREQNAFMIFEKLLGSLLNFILQFKLKHLFQLPRLLNGRKAIARTT